MVVRRLAMAQTGVRFPLPAPNIDKIIKIVYNINMQPQYELKIINSTEAPDDPKAPLKLCFQGLTREQVGALLGAESASDIGQEYLQRGDTSFFRTNPQRYLTGIDGLNTDSAGNIVVDLTAKGIEGAEDFARRLNAIVTTHPSILDAEVKFEL